LATDIKVSVISRSPGESSTDEAVELTAVP
jgi:hypothetical protein